jgi:hypothetical protein
MSFSPRAGSVKPPGERTVAPRRRAPKRTIPKPLCVAWSRETGLRCKRPVASTRRARAAMLCRTHLRSAYLVALCVTNDPARLVSLAFGSWTNFSEVVKPCRKSR